MIPHHTNLSQHKIKQTRQWLHWNWHLKWGNKDLSKVQGKVKREAQTRFTVEEMKEWGGGLGAEKIKTAPTKCTRVIWRNWNFKLPSLTLNKKPNFTHLQHILKLKYMYKHDVSFPHQTVPACKLWESVVALSISLVNTAAARPYVVLFALSITSFTSLNLMICCTGPNI